VFNLETASVKAAPIQQSTATLSAVQIARICVSASRPSRLTRTATETLSTESRFTADRRGTGSDPGSRTTSLPRPRIVVVQGATSARRSRGIAASRESTTTGRRPISANSHHQTSPRAGRAFTMRPLPVARRPDLPTHRVHRPGACRRRCSSSRSRLTGGERAMPPVLRQRARRRSARSAHFVHWTAAQRRRWCSTVCDSCHYYATYHVD
jgi:hypothetical protein